MKTIKLLILKYFSFIYTILWNLVTFNDPLDKLLTNISKLEKQEKKIYNFSIAAGNYIHQLNQLGNKATTLENKIKYYSLASHESNQCLTWLIQILEGKEIKAWKAKDTKELIKKIKSKTLLIVQETNHTFPDRKI